VLNVRELALGIVGDRVLIESSCKKGKEYVVLQDPKFAGLQYEGKMKLCGCTVLRVTKGQARVEISLLRVLLLEQYRKPEI
jgi:hypothetical protein